MRRTRKLNLVLVKNTVKPTREQPAGRARPQRHTGTDGLLTTISACRLQPEFSVARHVHVCMDGTRTRPPSCSRSQNIRYDPSRRERLYILSVSSLFVG
ncbi:hypothetical protein BDA96_01G064000 [Sorghum bicolor]|uniref:Uncharacterized protein n=1 Tax=Sorghum bicolor TaxID=4558 RepID=A0A921UWA0_SORBI|nr:hypothetical protein BDA96_01G064000 [Sorghum bicolor]